VDPETASRGRGPEPAPKGAHAPDKAALERLAASEAEKANLGNELLQARAKLAARGEADLDGLLKKASHLSQDDWTELAKHDTVMYQFPCAQAKAWTPSSELAGQLGLSPDDVETLRAAYGRSNRRLWALVKPICAHALGSEVAADTLGLTSCTHVVVTLATDKDPASAAQSMHTVGQIRAGQRQAPRADEALEPLTQMFLGLMGEMGLFEADLAQSMGPEEALRVASAERLCMARDVWGPD
jgi:hypothetical protein